MDDLRFDDLTRRLAQGISRRAAVQGGVAAFLGAVGLRGHAAAQVSQAQCGNKICAANPAVCTNGCVCCDYPNGNSRCRPPGTCSPGTEVPPPTTAPPTTTTTSTTPAPTSTTTSTTTPAPVITTGSVDATDPTSACFLGQNYDATVFPHGGGALSLAVRGSSSGGGTLVDPVLILYAGEGVPSSCDRILTDHDSGCDRDSYLETTQPAGTYTAVVGGISNGFGTYTLIRNGFVSDYCG